MWWQVLLVLAAWIVCSLLFGVVWALGHRDRRPHHCRACTMPKELGPLMKSATDHRHLLEPPTASLKPGEFRVPREWTDAPPRQSGRGYGGYGQHPAPVQAPVPMRVISPVPKAPKK